MAYTAQKFDTGSRSRIALKSDPKCRGKITTAYPSYEPNVEPGYYVQWTHMSGTFFYLESLLISEEEANQPVEPKQ